MITIDRLPRGRRRPAHGLARDLLLTVLLLAASSLGAPAEPAPRVSWPGSIREISLEKLAATAPTTAAGAEPRITRAVLTAEEQSAPLEFELALRMRHFDELQARVSRREIITREEMTANYLPLAADYETLARWLEAQGFTITRRDDSHLGLFARGEVSRVAGVFATTFARVTFEGGEFTSAISAPSVPAALAPALLGINGLQPHLRAHKLQLLPQAIINPPYTPSQILHAYNASGLGLDGTGQTVATVIDTFPNDSDLTTFWARYNIPETLANVTKIQVVAGTLNAPTGEETVDVQWSTAMAPGVKVRVYATQNLQPSSLDQGYAQVFADLPSNPSLRQVMLCFGLGESYFTPNQYQSEAQWLAALASQGVTVLASSGDGGSNPDPNTGRYSTSVPQQVVFPAGDPSVTSVGGTSLNLDDANGGTVTSETAWNGSGGGSSAIWSRPAWQTGPGVPSGTGRLVPDVSATADPQLGVLIYITSANPSMNGYVQIGGTSVSTPIWAGLSALIEQARTLAGQGSLGLLGPSIYPLLGTSSFRDIISGSNGAYTAGAGYDMVTGIGVPNVAGLVQSLVRSYTPVITSQPRSMSRPAGQSGTFHVAANGNPPPAYQWQRAPAGTSTWSNLSETTTYTGTTTDTLGVNSVTDAMNGDAFQCLVSNTNGTATSTTAYLVVAHPFVFTTFAGQMGTNGALDGTGTAAQFFDPADLTTDSAGNVYVADTNNQTIRKVTAGAAVTTFAGLAGAAGSSDGTGSAARFSHPMGLAVDSAGNVFVADAANNAIRKITSAGAVTTVVGPAAQLSTPSDVTVDGAGNLYIADTGHHTIRKVTPAGAVSTLAGLAGVSGSADGSGASARFYSPEGVTVDSAGNVYVADTNNSTIRKVTPAGVVTTVAGLAGSTGTADGPGTSARFDHPSDLALDAAGNLYVADTDNCTIRRIDTGGLVSYVAGGQAVAAVVGMTAMNYPTGVTVDSSGALFVADTNDHVIMKGTVASAPVITAQPASQTVNAGANVQFSVTASGGPAPSFQWSKGGTAISGATGSTLNLNNVQTTDAGSYTVTASNYLGSITSNPATLTVNAAPPPPSGGGGGGGGGGAIGACFVWGLAGLGIARLFGRRGR